MTVHQPDDRDAIDRSVETALQMLREGGEKELRATRILFDTLWPRFQRALRRLGASEVIAEELASDAVMKVLQAKDTLRDLSAFPKWSNTVVRNLFFTYLRDNRKTSLHEVQVCEEGWEAMFDTVADTSEFDAPTRLCLQGQLEAFFRDHPERARVIERCALEDIPLGQLSRELGRTSSAAREYLSQCRKRLWVYWQVCLERQS